MAKFTIVDDEELQQEKPRAKFTVVEDEPAQMAQPTPEPRADGLQLQPDLTTTGARFKRGFMSTLHGGAQALLHALPEGVIETVNKAADTVGGKGTFLGDKLGIKGMTKQELDQMLAKDQIDYEHASQTNPPGFDLAGIIGEGMSPLNVITAGGAGKAAVAKEGAKTVAAKLGLLGGTAAGLQPVTADAAENYGGEKLKQIGVGAATGAVLGPIMVKAADSLGQYVSNKIAQGKTRSPVDIGNEIRASLQKDGIDPSQIPEGVMFELTQDVKTALAKGKNLDPAALLRKHDFDKLGIKPTLGQITRDPTQYSRELNLRGVNGVGEPITNRLAEQQQGIQGLFQKGTKGAMEPYEAGKAMIKDIEGKNFEMEQGVRKAYAAFKESTGKDLEVPLQGMAQDFANINREFPIPGVVQNRFKEFGLMGGKQTKLMTVDDAEQLIKTINNNYNPMNPAEKRGLDELRKAVIGSIDNAAEASNDTLSAELAKAARATAKDRFSVIADNPAFKAAINKKAAPDDFVKKYVIGGKADEIERLTSLVSPETRDQMRVQFMRHLQNKAFGANAAGDSATRQASFNNELQNIGSKKLVAILGKEQAEEIQALGRVMAYIQSRPAGSSVNESGTASAVMNILSKTGMGRALPFVKDLVNAPIEAAKKRSAVENALTAKLPNRKADLDPKVMRALSRLVGASTVLSGAAAGQAVQ